MVDPVKFEASTDADLVRYAGVVGWSRAVNTGVVTREVANKVLELQQQALDEIYVGIDKGEDKLLLDLWKEETVQ